jgi:hypothetical protein
MLARPILTLPCISLEDYVFSASGRHKQGGPDFGRGLYLFSRLRLFDLQCRLLAVRPEGANHQWRKIPPRELSIDLVADERLGRVTGRAGAS